MASPPQSDDATGGGACPHCGEIHPVSYTHCPRTGRALNTGRALIGRVIAGRYRVIGLLGEGGMGAVYIAEHTLIGRKVALKRLHPELASDEKAVKRFQREAQAAAATGHHHIVEILDLGYAEDGAPYLVMEYLRGQSLASLLRKEKRIEPRRACNIVGQVLAALEAVHKQQIVHRDLKPDNVFLTRKSGNPDYVKLLDFGISKVKKDESEALDLTRTGVMLGTPFYMSPEQARGMKNLDQRVDLYSVGVILYESITGRVPFEGDNYHQLLQAILRFEAPPLRDFVPDVDPELESIVMRSIAKDPAARWTTASQMLQALLPHGANLPDAEADAGQSIRPAYSPSTSPTPGSSVTLNYAPPPLPSQTGSDVGSIERPPTPDRAMPSFGRSSPTPDYVSEARSVELRAFEPRPSDPRHPEPRSVEARGADSRNVELRSTGEQRPVDTRPLNEARSIDPRPFEPRQHGRAVSRQAPRAQVNVPPRAAPAPPPAVVAAGRYFFAASDDWDETRAHGLLEPRTLLTSHASAVREQPPSSGYTRLDVPDVSGVREAMPLPTPPSGEVPLALPVARDLAEIKGSLVLGAFDYLTGTYGAGMLSHLSPQLEPEVQHHLDGVILPMAWIPTRIYELLLRGAERAFGAGDGALSAGIGRATADREMATTHRLFMQTANPAMVAERVPQVLRLYHSRCEAKLLPTPGGGTRLEIDTGTPESFFHAWALAGFVQRMLELSGARDARVSVVSCRGRGDERTALAMRFK